MYVVRYVTLRNVSVAKLATSIPVNAALNVIFQIVDAVPYVAITLAHVVLCVIWLNVFVALNVKIILANVVLTVIL